MPENRRRAVATLFAAGAVQAAAAAAAALLSTRFLPVGDRGVMVVALALPALLTPVVALGTNNAVRSVLPGTPDGSASGVVAAYTRLGVATALLGGLLAALLCFPVALLTDRALARPDFLVAVAVATIVQVLVQQLTEVWFAHRAFQAGARWAAGAALAGLAGVAIGCANGASAPTLVLVQSVGSAVVLAASARHAARGGVIGLREYDAGQARRLLGLGTRSLGLPLGTAVMLRADRLVLAAVTGPQTVATYALAATVAETVRLAPTAVAQLFASDVAERREVSIVRTQTYSLVTVTVLGLLLLLLARVFFVPVFGAAYRPSVGLLAVLLLAEWGFTLFGLAVRGLVGGGWSSDASAVGVVAGIAAVPAYAVGAELGGATGCAGAGVVLYTVVGLYGTSRLLRRSAPEVYDAATKGSR